MPISGETIRAARRRMGLSRARLAEQIGISPRSIEAWECGRYPLQNIDIAIKLADALLLDRSELLDGAAYGRQEREAPGDSGTEQELEEFVFAQCVRHQRQSLGLEGLLKAFERSLIASCREEALSRQEKDWKAAWERFLDSPKKSEESPSSDLDNLPCLFLEARSACGLTQAELARQAGTDQATVSRLESGKRLPSLPLLEKLANVLHKELYITLC